MADADAIQKVKDAKAPSWKKVLIWIGVGLLLLTAIVVVLIVVVNRKSPADAVSGIVDYAREQIAKADIDAQIATAKAEGIEDATVKQLEAIREIKDEQERARRLAELF